MKYRRYTTDDHPGRDPIADTPVPMSTWRVVLRRAKGSPGGLTAYVRAKDAATAKEALENGRSPGIGLGWRVVGTPTEVPHESAPNAPRVA